NRTLNPPDSDDHRQDDEEQQRQQGPASIKKPPALFRRQRRSRRSGLRRRRSCWWRHGWCHGLNYSFVMVSSKFKIARLTMAHAATLWRFTSGGIFAGSERATLAAAAVRSSK